MLDAEFGDLGGLIEDALTRASAAGLDWISATRRAAQIVRAARPDLTPDEAYSLVELTGTRRRRRSYAL
jgi:hypothetical protein